jgi:hypothetical protein
MEENLLQIINILFYIFHALLILFNVLGWLFRSLRYWNLISLLATAFSWFVLGIWKGWGYCPCTDWHFEVRRQLDLEVQSSSYIDFLLISAVDLHFSRSLIDSATLLTFLVCLCLSSWVNYRKINLLNW